MNYNDIFEAYYTQYRAEATVPVGAGLASTAWDDEYTIGMRLANEAISRWANYDSTYWRELWTTNQLDNSSGTQTITTGTTVYTAPANFAEAGGNVVVRNSNGVMQTYPIIEPQEVQNMDGNATYAYFRNNLTYYSTGTASQSGTTITGVGTTWTAAMVGMEIEFVTGETATITAFTSTTSLTAANISQTVASGTYRIISRGKNLVLNPAPPSTLNGMDIDYNYYKKPAEITSGVSEPEMSNPYYIVHRMLANRFRASRNPYYGSASKDAEDALRIMQGENNSGNWSQPPTMADTSGTGFGV